MLRGDESSRPRRDRVVVERRHARCPRTNSTERPRHPSIRNGSPTSSSAWRRWCGARCGISACARRTCLTFARKYSSSSIGGFPTSTRAAHRCRRGSTASACAARRSIAGAPHTCEEVPEAEVREESLVADRRDRTRAQARTRMARARPRTRRRAPSHRLRPLRDGGATDEDNRGAARVPAADGLLSTPPCAPGSRKGVESAGERALGVVDLRVSLKIGWLNRGGGFEVPQARLAGIDARNTITNERLK